MRLNVTVVQVTMWVQNCMVVSRSADGPVLVVDPGGDLDRIMEAIAGRTVEGVLVTHGHIDHIGALDEIADATRAPVWYHPDDVPLYRSVRVPENATALADGDEIEVAGIELRVLHTPGHSPGSVSFVHATGGLPPAEQVVFAGDVLFNGSVGRTDLPGGDFETLTRSIETKLWPLSDETVVLPGHGPPTKIGHEKVHNPFVGKYANFP